MRSVPVSWHASAKFAGLQEGGIDKLPNPRLLVNTPHHPERDPHADPITNTNAEEETVGARKRGHQPTLGPLLIPIRRGGW